MILELKSFKSMFNSKKKYFLEILLLNYSFNSLMHKTLKAGTWAKNTKCHTKGVRKFHKKCHVLFEWLLILANLALIKYTRSHWKNIWNIIVQFYLLIVKANFKFKKITKTFDLLPYRSVCEPDQRCIAILFSSPVAKTFIL